MNHHKPEDTVSPTILSDRIKECESSLFVLDSSGLVFNDPHALAETYLGLSLPGGSKKLKVLARGIDILSFKTNFASIELSDEDSNSSAILKHALQAAPLDLIAASELIKSSIVSSGLDELRSFESTRRSLAEEEDHYRLLLKGAQLAGLEGSYAEAMPLMDSVLELCAQIFGSEDEEMAACEHAMASLLRLQARFQRAEAHERRALTIIESVVDGPRDTSYSYEDRSSPNPFTSVAHVNQPIHPKAGKVTIYLSSLGRVLRGLGKFVEAEAVLRRAMSIKDAAAEVRIKAGNGCTSRYEEEDEEAIKIANELAAVCLDQGKREEAIVLHMRSIKAMQFQVKQRSTAESKKSPALANYLMKLAQQWQEAKGLVEATDLFEEADFEYNRACGSNHPLTLTCLFRHADALRQMRRMEEALALAQKAYEGRGRILGVDHSLTLESMDQIIYLLLEMKDFNRAEPLMRKALAYLELQASRSTHPSNSQVAKIASRQHGIARLLDVRSVKTGSSSRSEEAEAVGLYSRAFASRQSVMGFDHRDTLSSLSFLAMLEARIGTRAKEHGISNEGSLEKAASHFETLVEILLRRAEAGVKEEGKDAQQLARSLLGFTSVLTQISQGHRFKPLLCFIDRAIALKRGEEEEALKKTRLSVAEAVVKYERDLKLSKKVAASHAASKNRSIPPSFLTGLERAKRLQDVSGSKLQDVSGSCTPRVSPPVAEKSQGRPSTPAKSILMINPLSSISDHGVMRARRVSTPTFTLQQESSTSSLEDHYQDRFSLGNSPHGNSFPPASPTRSSAANQACGLPPIPAQPPSAQKKRRDQARSESTERQSRQSARTPLRAALAPFQFIKAFIPMSNRD